MSKGEKMMRGKEKKTREQVESQINLVNSEIADLSAQKADKALDLAKLRASLNQLEERFSETAGAASLAREGACVRPGVNEAALLPGEREEYHAAREAVNTASVACNGLESLIADKDSVLADLLQERLMIVCCSAADEMISFQAQVKRVSEEIRTLQGAIASQEKIISEAKEKTSPECNLSAKRAEVLADIALKKATSNDLEDIDKQIQESDRKSSAARNQATQAIVTANQTITGLRVKLEKVESELKGLEARKTVIVHDFLTAEAEKIGEEYLKAFNSLEASFRRLIALDRIMKRNGCKTIGLAKKDEILIPAFDLKSHADRRGKISESKSVLQLINTASGRNNELEGDVAAEINRWKTSGIEF